MDWVKSCIAIIFLSKPGAGKGTITRHIRNIIGPAHATQLSNPRHLFGDYGATAQRWAQNGGARNESNINDLMAYIRQHG